MKLTKETLKQIIKEELEVGMDEGVLDMFRKKKAMPAEEPAEQSQPSGDQNFEIKTEELTKFIRSLPLEKEIEATVIEMLDRYKNDDLNANLYLNLKENMEKYLQGWISITQKRATGGEMTDYGIDN